MVSNKMYYFGDHIPVLVCQNNIVLIKVKYLKIYGFIQLVYLMQYMEFITQCIFLS